MGHTNREIQKDNSVGNAKRPRTSGWPTDRRNHVVQAGVVLLTIINNGNKLPVIPMVRRFRDAHLSSPNVLGRRRRRKMLSPNIPSQLQRFH